MKKIPIKIEKALKMNYKFIEWKLHNVCNNDCSFCGVMHKDGSQRWFDLETYKKYVDKLVKLCEGQPFWFQLTGGEPTLFPEIDKLIAYMHQKNAYISLISNGARTIKWWEELKETKSLNTLFLTFHSEQTFDYKHIADIANLFHNEPVKVVCLITHTKDSLNIGFEAFDYLTANTGAFILMKAMVVRQYNIYSYYTPEQLHRLKRAVTIGKLPGKKTTLVPAAYDINHTLRISYSDGSSNTIDPQLLMKNNENRFEGWQCDIGHDTMRIDCDIVYRGVCGLGGSRHLDDDLSFMTDSIVCTSSTCNCGTDMIATKILPTDRYPNNR